MRLVPSFQDSDVVVPEGTGKGGTGDGVVVTKPLPPAPQETSKGGIGGELRPDEIVLAEYDESGIREMCANSSWADSRNVVVNCEARVGGVGMFPIPIHPQTLYKAPD